MKIEEILSIDIKDAVSRPSLMEAIFGDNEDLTSDEQEVLTSLLFGLKSLSKYAIPWQESPENRIKYWESHKDEIIAGAKAINLLSTKTPEEIRAAFELYERTNK